ncbi:L-lactate dehydrogenase, partial [Corallococcus coralloides]|nr:L-lactate dehydrogenase [Corallococcus coralloides]
VKGQIKILADSGIRNGLDVVRTIALGADAAMIGRAFIYALAAAGEAGVKHVLELLEKEMRVAMTLTSVAKVSDITGDLLVKA